jgi:hypothetical protein
MERTGSVLDFSVILFKLVNDSVSDNHIEASFFLPLADSTKFLIAGNGQSVLVKLFSIQPSHKDDDERISLSMERRTCECCGII